MKYVSIVGVVLIVISLIYYYLAAQNIYFSGVDFIFGTFFGIGVGLLIGGIVGWFSNRSKK